MSVYCTEFKANSKVPWSQRLSIFIPWLYSTEAIENTVVVNCNDMSMVMTCETFLYVSLSLSSIKRVTDFLLSRGLICYNIFDLPE